MQVYRTNQVFVPGGMPTLTYVSRSERNLERRLSAANDNLCKLVTVTGATKSGKTVLTKKIFPKGEHVWVDGGTVKQEDDLWNFILESIDGHTIKTDSSTKEHSAGISGEVAAKGAIPLLVEGTGKVGTNYGGKRTKGSTETLALNPRAAAISQLRQVNCALIIDDFHYLNRDFQGNVVRALKPLIFDGQPVIFIAIPHRRFDAIKVEREITARLESIDVPSWEIDELLQIPTSGFPLLKIDVHPDVCRELAREAYGSPHLMQEFCRLLATDNGVTRTATSRVCINSVQHDLFHRVAENTHRAIFEKLAKGPRARRERVARKLRSGKDVDVYEIVLHGLSHISPGLQTIRYEQLRSAMREILEDPEQIPQAQDVRRVLTNMAEIALSDESSTPVFDWEKEEDKLHVTDPFFAFYLKWGVNG